MQLIKRAEGLVRFDLIVVVLPDVDCGLGMSAGFELYGGEYLVLELPVGAFVVLVLRRRTRNDLDRRDDALHPGVGGHHADELLRGRGASDGGGAVCCNCGLQVACINSQWDSRILVRVIAVGRSTMPTLNATVCQNGKDFFFSKEQVVFLFNF